MKCVSKFVKKYKLYDNDYEFKFYFDEWPIYKDGDIFAYSDNEFNNLYEIKENEKNV